MAESAAILMDGGDGIAGVAADAECGRQNRGRMAVGMAGEIGGVASGATPSLDGSDMFFVDRIGQSRGGGVTEAAVVQVDCHRIIGRVTGADAGRGVGDMAQCSQAGAGMIHQSMLAGPVMAGEAAGGVDTGCNDLLDGNAGGGSRHAGGIVTHGAGVFMRPKNAGPGQGKLGVTGVARLPLGLIEADSLADGMDMAVAAKGAGVATIAFAGLVDGRTDAATVGWAMAGGAAKGLMHLVRSRADEW